MELSSAPFIQVTPSGISSGATTSIPLLARIYRLLGTWQWALSPGLDDETVQGNGNQVKQDAYFSVF